MTILCVRCNEEKEPNEFYVITDRRHGGKKLSTYCKQCCRNQVTERRMALIEPLKIKKECVKCGYDRCSRALHFHHVDSAEKRFSVAELVRKLNSKNLEDLKRELAKCILVCANCHAEIHEGILALNGSESRAYQQNLSFQTKNVKEKKAVRQHKLLEAVAKRESQLSRNFELKSELETRNSTILNELELDQKWGRWERVAKKFCLTSTQVKRIWRLRSDSNRQSTI